MYVFMYRVQDFFYIIEFWSIFFLKTAGRQIFPINSHFGVVLVKSSYFLVAKDLAKQVYEEERNKKSAVFW